jgi:predicted phage tail protein
VLLRHPSLYGAVMLLLWLRVRGEAHTDERDHEIERHASSTGGGITGLAVLAGLIMLALDAPQFWTATVLFVGSFLGSLASIGVSLATYRTGL